MHQPVRPEVLVDRIDDMETVDFDYDLLEEVLTYLGVYTSLAYGEEESIEEKKIFSRLPEAEDYLEAHGADKTPVPNYTIDLQDPPSAEIERWMVCDTLN